MLIFSDGLQELLNPDYRLGLIVLFIGILGLGFWNTFHQKITIHSDNILLNLFYQFAFAGIVQLIFAFAFTKNYDFEKWSAESFVYVVYLGVLVGDYLLCVSLCTKRVNPSQISMLNYVNTIIAIFLGWLILDEKITTKFIFAAILIIFWSLYYEPKKGNV